MIDFAKLNFVDMKSKDYNKSLDPNKARLMETFNSFGFMGQPEVVMRNQSFFAALAIVGIKPVGARIEGYYSPHQRRFNLLGQTVAMYGAHGAIASFKVPELGAYHLHHTIAKDSMTYTGDIVVGKGNHIAIRAREKLDGVEVVVFGVEYTSGLVQYFMWDEASIYPIRSSQPCRFEKIKSEYYLLSDVPPNFVVDLKYKTHEWEILSEELVMVAKEGIILDMDTVQYKIPATLTYTVEVKDNVAVNSRGQKVCDIGIEDGLYDVSVEKNEIVKKRDDRVYADSPDQIDVIKRCAMGLSDVKKYFYLSKERKKYFGIMMKLGKNDDLIKELNGGVVCAPNLTPRVSVELTHRKDHIRRYLASISTDGVCVMDYPGLDKIFYQDSLYVKDGMVMGLRYIPQRMYSEEDMSNYPQLGYDGALVRVEENLVRGVGNCVNFLYGRERGWYLIYYDPRRWRFKPPLL
jgi:hypothetical protein